MTRKIVVQPTLPASPKDSHGSYVLATPAEADSPQPVSSHMPNMTLDDMLKRQMNIMERVTIQLHKKASRGDMTKDEIQSLATCIKVTMELKIKQNELLEDLSDEDLEKIAESE